MLGSEGKANRASHDKQLAASASGSLLTSRPDPARLGSARRPALPPRAVEPAERRSSNECAYSFCQLWLPAERSGAWRRKQREGQREKDESVRRTSWSWPGGPGSAATARRQKKRGGGGEGRLLFRGSFWCLPPLAWGGWHQRAERGSLSECFQPFRKQRIRLQLLPMNMLKEGVTAGFQFVVTT